MPSDRRPNWEEREIEQLVDDSRFRCAWCGQRPCVCDDDDDDDALFDADELGLDPEDDDARGCGW